MSVISINDFIKESVMNYSKSEGIKASTINYVLLKDGKIKSGFFSYINNEGFLTLKLFSYHSNRFSISNEIFKIDNELYFNKKIVTKLILNR